MEGEAPDAVWLSSTPVDGHANTIQMEGERDAMAVIRGMNNAGDSTTSLSTDLHPLLSLRGNDRLLTLPIEGDR